jgi:malonyl-CoA decarboxylase
MVNYRYDLGEIERNHEAFANEGEVVASRNVRGLLRAPAKGRLKKLTQAGQPAIESRKPATAIATPSETKSRT